jgi:hypothetical protein
MNPASDVLVRKLCYILHRGFVESRRLAQQAQDQQLFDLADAFEQIPGFVPDWNDQCLDQVRSNLRIYQGKYGPKAFDYLGILDMDDQAFMDVLSRW